MIKLRGFINGYKENKLPRWRYLSLCMAVAGFTACQDDLGKNGNGGDADLNPADVFDYATAHDLQLNIDYTVPAGYPVDFELYTQNPVSLTSSKSYEKDTTLVPFFSGRTDANGKLSLPLNGIPAFVSDVYLYAKQIGTPRVIRGQVEGHTLRLNNSQAVVKSAPAVTKGSPTGPYYKNWLTQDVQLVDRLGDFAATDGRPAYLLADKLTLPIQAKRIIDATLPDEDEGILDPRFYRNLGSGLHVSEESHVKLYFYHHNSERENVLAYYTYPDGVTPDQHYVNNNLVLAYPNLNNIAEGEGVQLKYYDGQSLHDRFPANVNIGFVILVDAFADLIATPAGSAVRNVNVAYSGQNWNGYDFKGSKVRNRPHSAVFTAAGHFILAFQDQPWGTTYKDNHGSQVDQVYSATFRNDIFVIEADPVTALPDVPDGQDPDQVPGKVWQHGTGILTFEDLWPSRAQGDFDMNDVVVKYELQDYMNTDFQMTGLEGDFVFVHNGAGYPNGFGFQLNTVNRDNAEVTVTSDYVCAGQGLDPALDKATVMLFDDGRKVPVGTTFHVQVKYKQPVAYYQYQMAPYNPFIVINNRNPLADNRAELHLTNYIPTGKVNRDLFHTSDDLSEPDKGIYYVSASNYPFAIHLAGVTDFVLPDEKTPIDRAYPKFKSWAESKGQQDKDWYVK